MSEQEPSLNYKLSVDPTPMPKDIPQVDEVGATSGPLYSAAYFIGARCKPYNDDFILCKEEAQGKGEIDCLKEGRRVTRCASSVIKDINAHCAESFKLHYTCMNEHNMEYFECRKAETLLRKCVFDNLKLDKHIPDAEGEQVHLKKNPMYKPIYTYMPQELAYEKAEKEGKI
ncbi:NADH-ubiquinone oxidoreductase 20.8 kDa subunit [Wickerhamomyces ciferrii]|uniref:NADH-ubiquinone oxidoreductase n=1 Tax=Wickerhamomyces ciferrii (strain ATCC 14091 / BCRC 22168 / CBS 111 / JCM 3599 / NBRC 0793 / NRRL Y-1031 F-60-10) TaxID=1206466 RepID=K0KLU1_WICCF|nr:NADH-ubiquinone oxidoreductase 20.8 kDa subunit [Wickerhamomyces ciferrii]CCH42294.1 NADH-ubiquinone oxidoreductase 20.8 kDa subunit [Wickerhamomyces ciferrii]